MVTTQQLTGGNDYDSSDMAQHCHSDVDIDQESNPFADKDPYYEYFKAHCLTQYEKKLDSAFYKFEKIGKIPRLSDDKNLFFSNQEESDLIKEQGQIYTQTYVAEMISKLELEATNPFFTSKRSWFESDTAKSLLKNNGEVRKFRDYQVKNQEIDRHCLAEFNSMNQVRENIEQKDTAFLKDVIPTTSHEEFFEFPSKFDYMKEVSEDLEAFQKYSSFSLNSIESVMTAEQVHNRVNRGVETGKRYRYADLKDPILGMDSLATSNTKLDNDHEVQMLNSFHRKQSTVSESSVTAAMTGNLTQEQLRKMYTQNLLKLLEALSLSFND